MRLLPVVPVSRFVAFTKRERVKWGDIVRRSIAKID